MANTFAMLVSMVRPRAISLPFILLLAACAPKAPDLPAEEVLRRATVAAQSMSSASFTVDGTMTFAGGAFGSGKATVRLDGAFENGGQTVASTVDLSAVLSGIEGENQRVVSVFDIILVQGQRLFLKVHALEAPGNLGILDETLVGKLIGTWWTFDAPEERSSASVTPSANLLKSQASVVLVTRDLGTARLDGETVYHYAVAIDPEKFLAYAEEAARESGEEFNPEEAREAVNALQATGELWIRASDFTVRKIAWEIPALPMPDGSDLRLNFTLLWKDHDGQTPIVIPENVQPFSAMQLLPSDAALEAAAPVPGIPEGELRNAIEEYSDTVILPPQE